MNDTPTTPTTAADALATYTLATRQKWAAERLQNQAFEQLQADLKSQSAALSRQVQRLLVGTSYFARAAKYFPLVDHSQVPMTAQAVGQIQLSGRTESLGCVHVQCEFRPDQEAAVLAHLETILRA